MIKPTHDRSFPGLTSEEAAAAWLMRMVDTSFDESERAEFEAWRDADRDHAQAFERVREVWDAFDEAGGDPTLAALRQEALAHTPDKRRYWWLAAGTAIAASLAALLVVGPSNLPVWSANAPDAASPSMAPAVETALFETAKGEQRIVALADGSKVTLDTDSGVRVGFTSERRLVSMIRGQALFEVAKDPNRPFIVQAGNRRITAIGTVFDVRVDRDRMQVALIEGRVLVDRMHGANAGSPPAPTVLTAGHELTAEGLTYQKLVKVDVERTTLWRDGLVSFEDEPLSAVVAEMNRYSSDALVFDRPETGQMRVSGIFRTGDPERLAGILGELLPLQAHRLPDGSIEIARKSEKIR